MNTCVVDVSVAAKWWLPAKQEDYSDQAVEILSACTAGKIEVLVPDHFYAEMGNVLWKSVRTQRITTDAAFIALQSIQNLDLTVVSSADLLGDALRIALDHHRTVYDCLYVALAVRSSTDFITADERLANALAAYLPVKWLGAF